MGATRATLGFSAVMHAIAKLKLRKQNVLHGSSMSANETRGTHDDGKLQAQDQAIVAIRELIHLCHSQTFVFTSARWLPIEAARQEQVSSRGTTHGTQWNQGALPGVPRRHEAPWR
jgi:hypothetical protein